MAEPAAEWRLAQIERRVERIEPVVTDVALLKRDMETLTKAMDNNTRATNRVGEQLEKAQMEPIARRIAWWNQLALAAIGALLAGGFALIGALIAGGHP